MLSKGRPGHKVAWSLHSESPHCIGAADGEVSEEEEPPEDQMLREQLEQLDGPEKKRYGYVHFDREYPAEVKRTLAELHTNLSHPHPDTMARMLTLAGADPAMIEASRHLRCEVCHRASPPRPSAV